ncbi:DUF6510 family protein [Tsukamurella pseudospumae]|uniref:Uncharacterized protein n=1 Tax=Tsukamurella pseudospumae TaxID=239498 RepID=A0A138ABY7_9ACTN|nr:DUF6510 family protein [Tsukamurella pseudospumae]KXP01012.1 hypothetical protein AXK61_13555 [Tsukamurella pseudospumae]KXP07889.1 hypothetical protein AXK60_09760 [Tsukamurella pseudospumae]
MAELDGNAAAGPLAEVFGVDLSAAAAECAGCGAHGEIAIARVFATAMGLVMRCRACEAVLAVLVSRDGRWRCRLTGIATLDLR